MLSSNPYLGLCHHYIHQPLYQVMFSYMYVCRGERGGRKGIKQLASWPVGLVWMYGNPVPSQAEAFQSSLFPIHILYA